MQACRSTSDVISNLPNSVIQDILSRLSIRDAAKTSVMSKPWRYKWREIPHLVFDRNFCPLYPGDRQSAKELFFNIFRVLLLHIGTIKKFKLGFLELGMCPEIDQLMLFLSDKHVKEFCLDIFNQPVQQMPSSLFLFEHLRRLTIGPGILKIPATFGGFHRLIFLQFCMVTFDWNLQASFISKCPLLEHLDVDFCNNVGPFVIDFPNLKFLNIFRGVDSICFKSTPLLANVGIFLVAVRPNDERAQTSTLIKFIKCLPALEHWTFPIALCV